MADRRQRIKKELKCVCLGGIIFGLSGCASAVMTTVVGQTSGIGGNAVRTGGSYTVTYEENGEIQEISGKIEAKNDSALTLLPWEQDAVRIGYGRIQKIEEPRKNYLYISSGAGIISADENLIEQANVSIRYGRQSNYGVEVLAGFWNDLERHRHIGIRAYGLTILPQYRNRIYGFGQVDFLEHRDFEGVHLKVGGWTTVPLGWGLALRPEMGVGLFVINWGIGPSIGAAVRLEYGIKE